MTEKKKRMFESYFIQNRPENKDSCLKQYGRLEYAEPKYATLAEKSL